MATGPEHYLCAEEFLDRAVHMVTGGDMERYCLAAAQVHATLALAAATAINDPDGGQPTADADDWHHTVGVQRNEPTTPASLPPDVEGHPIRGPHTLQQLGEPCRPECDHDPACVNTCADFDNGTGVAR